LATAVAKAVVAMLGVPVATITAAHEVAEAAVAAAFAARGSAAAAVVLESTLDRLSRRRAAA
jgi:hypothetical protein